MVSTSQHGSGSADQRKEYCDLENNLIWTEDERGVIHHFEYDLTSGGMTRRIEDVNTSLVTDEPSGWSHLGAHLITDYEIDARGRTLEEHGPEHEIDVNGSSTTVRRAVWTICDDFNNRVTTGSGYKSGSSTYVLSNPVSITVTDKKGNTLEEIQATRASTSGKLLDTDTFAQSSYVAWTTYQYTDCCKLASSSSSSSVTSTNNMVLVTYYEYDDGNDMSDGNLTKTTQHVDDTTTRVTTYDYDFRNRRIAVHGELGQSQKFSLDNLSRITQTDRVHISTSAGSSSSSAAPTETLIGRETVMFDDRGRIYKKTRYAVDPDTGTVGESLSDHTWYDEAGNVVKHQPAGTDLLTKTEYDNLGRVTGITQGYENSGSDRIFESTHHTYDDADNLIFTQVKQRHHDVDETLSGALGSHNSTTTPRSRTSYLAHWHDHLGRLLASADYGTNGNSSLTRPALIPSRSDTVLVTTNEYSDAGLLESTTDPAGIVTSFEYDALDRRITTIENEVASGTANDENRTTRMTYTADGQLATLTAENDDTGDQVTTYTYGTTLLDSEIATSHLLRCTKYPDSTGTSDSVFHGYNRQGQVIQTTDQNGNVHQLDYDALGRLVEEAVTTLGSGVDDSVRRLATRYDIRGLAETITSHDNATAGLGNVVNEIHNEYNDFGQLTTQYQQHDAAVNTSTSPKVQYSYTDGSNGHIRPTGLTYPNGRQVTYSYGSYSHTRFNRVKAIQYESSPAKTVDYEYLGLSRPVVVDHGTYEPRLSYHSLSTVSSEEVNLCQSRLRKA